MDMSLDDIIKKTSYKRGSSSQRGRSQNSGGVRRNNVSRPNRTTSNNRGRPNNKPLQNSNVRINKTDRRSGGVADARLKIIQKNRMKVTDAREKLMTLARQTDARSKIKGRNQRGQQGGGRGGRRQPLEDFRRQPVEDFRRQGNIRSGGNQRQAPVLLQRSIKNNGPHVRPNDLIRCTINRPMLDYSDEASDMFVDDEDMSFTGRARNDLSNIKVVAHNDFSNYGQEYSSPMSEPMYMDYELPTVFNRQLEPSRGLTMTRNGARMSQEMRARLDTPPPAKPTGMFSWHQPAAVARPAAPSPPPANLGHRIVVSNLHASVTHEDIKELFEDIGPLLASRLVRAGTAEVIYKYQKDARKAVEAYHNRQLDGQPMKCLLVNPRSPNSSSSGVLRSNNVPVTPKFPSSSKSTVIPDLSAIHKALFMNK